MYLKHWILVTKLAFPSLNSFIKQEIFGILLVKWAAIEASSILNETPLNYVKLC